MLMQHRLSFLKKSGNVLALPDEIFLPITNPGAESGTTGWTARVGGLFTAEASGNGSANRFTVSATLGTVSWYQTITIPSQYEAAVDSGRYKTQLLVDVLGHSDADSYRIWLIHYNASGQVIGCYLENFIDPGTSWVPEVTKEIVCPIGTRSIRIEVDGARVSGTELSVYLDNFVPKLVKQNYISSVMVNGDYTLSGTWTTVSGPALSSNGAVGTWLWQGLGFVSAASASYYKEYSFTAPELVAVAAGTATMFWGCTMANANGDDTCRMWIEFRDGSNAIVGVTQQTGASNINPGLYGTLYALSVTVPTTAVKIRMNLSFGRVDGTVLDAAVCRIYSLLRIPS